MNEIIIGDSLMEMEGMEDGCIDLTVTSPPFNKGERKSDNVILKGIHYDAYKDDIPEDHYQDNQIKVLNEIYRLTKIGGSCFYHHVPRYKKDTTIFPLSWIAKSKWFVKQQIIWNKKLTPNMRDFRFYQFHEEIWHLYKPDPDPEAGALELNGKTAQYSSVWEIPLVKTPDTHPCPFIPEIPKRCIKACSHPGDLVFDPYAGIGTTLDVARKMDRNWLGIEISENYVKEARKIMEYDLF